MKLLVIIFIASILVSLCWRIIKGLIHKKRDSKNNTIKMDDFFSLDDGNQTELLISTEVSSEWLSSIKEKYDWNTFDYYDNLMWEYMYKLYNPALEKFESTYKNEFWYKLNRSQKVFCTFLTFNYETDNGGIFQFIFNCPEFIFAASEMFDEIGMKEISEDYKEVLKELLGKTEKMIDLKSIFNDTNRGWEKRWNSFTQGKKELKSLEKIEKYFGETEFEKKYYKKLTDYVENNMERFIIIKQ